MRFLDHIFFTFKNLMHMKTLFKFSYLFLSSLYLLFTSCVSDISVQDVEVTQAIQDGGHSATLIAQRSTSVRVTVNTNGANINGVTGILRVFAGGTEVTPAGGIAPIGSLNAVASPNRDVEAHTLNFEMPAPTVISASNDVDFRVELTPVVGETNIANNTGSRDNLTFVSRTTPNIFFTRIDYTPAGAGLPALADVQSGRGDLFVRGIYPVNDADPNLYRQGLFPTLPYSTDPNNDNIVNAGSEVSDVLAFLASCRQLIVDNGLGAANNTFLYGFMAGNPIDGNGWAPVGGFVAFGNTQDVRYQRTFAHELGHNFGLNHNSNTLNPETGWDVGARLPGNPAGNNVTGRVKPTTMNDIMVGGQLTNSAWITLSNYNFFAGSSILSDAPDRFEPDKRLVAERVAVVQGIFNLEGTQLISLEPVFRYPWLSQPSFRNQEEPFQAIVTTNTGEVIKQNFNPLLGDDSDNTKEVYGFFEVMLPVPPRSEINSVRIIDTRNDKEMGVVQSSRPPRINVIAPQSGAVLGASTELKWEVADPDTRPELLMYNISYSPDNGRNWVPVGVRVRGTSFTIPTDQIQAAREGKGILRVYVSDGLGNDFDDVDKLRTNAAKY